ncbi:hypothetical protein [Actinoplanes friuliensis]|uniref:Uncharacterized protein n=1 Tax=Actinoplanes friuliensis DSM 7358 TaxID=1246995 RepID=U5VPV4_9ACTN|nr:hypothetical protein [Actinoplanes friuliensis]AGZ38834.1 hypothetical protein AFR_02725 [Actinoplanes friuliensis DSM 7358]
MTTLLTRPAPAPAAASRPALRPWLAAVPWLLVAVVLAGALYRADVPGREIATYGLYFLAGVVPPGTLVHRAIRGSRGNLPEDLGYGAATGLFVQIVGWALAAATGLQALLIGWPVLVLVAFVAVPRLRQHWRIAEPEPLPLRWSWLICGALLGVIAWGAAAWSGTPLPPADAVYYQDLMYHLALVQEMTRAMPFEVPQLAGDTLRYHYLSDADMAAASMITGISPATVLLRLWMVPIGATAVLVVAALTRELSGKWWAGPLAGGVAFAGMPLTLGAPIDAYGGSSLSYASPSQTYAMPLLGLLVAIVVDLLRGRKLGPASFLAPPLALVCAGAKSSALPPLIAGLGLAALVVWWRDKRFPRAAAGLLLALTVVMLIGTRLFAGGGAGTLGVQPLSLLRWMEPYSKTLGTGDGVAPGGLIAPGLQGIGLTGGGFVAGVIGWWVLMQSPRLLGLLSLRRRSDPAAWLLGGMTVAGAGAAWALWHPSASQLYFFLCAAPFGVVLTVWMLAERTRHWWVPVAGLLAGALWSVVAPVVAAPARNTLGGWAWALAVPVLRTLGLVVIAAILVLALRRRFRVLATAVTAAVLGASLATGLAGFVRVLGQETGQPSTARMVTQEEMGAALWLDEHAADDDVVATNVHCTPMARYQPCDARAFWVAGLGGHRTLVESWAYSDETVAANGVGGLKYVLQPPPDQALYDLNQRAFTTADPADLTRLRQQYGVKWLFADTRAGEVSPDLARLAQLRHTSGPVTIYELR